MPTDLPRWIRRFLRDSPTLPPEVITEVERLGEAARPWLLAIARGDFGGGRGAGAEGSARSCAIDMLARLPSDDETIAVCIRAITDSSDPAAAESASQALSWWGAPAVPALLAAIPVARPAAQTALASALAATRVRDARILALLLDRMRADPPEVRHLGTYDDPAALPEVARAFDDYDLGQVPPDDISMAIFEFEGVVLRLGGELTPDQSEKLERARRRFRRTLRDAGIDPDKHGDPISTIRNANRAAAFLARAAREARAASAAAEAAAATAADASAAPPS